jgi:hypothetical protein
LPDTKLNEFVEKLKAAAAGNLRAVILYGSAATDEFHANHSDLNILCALNQAGSAQVAALHAPVNWWTRHGHRAPLVFTLEELNRSADIFTIELLDMKARHRVLYGENVLEQISVPVHYHAIQVERELRTTWVRLRQAILAAPDKPKAHLEIMLASFSAFVALFRHALIAMGGAPSQTRREAIDRIAQFSGADPAGFLTALEIREGKLRERDVNATETLSRYFQFVEAATDKFDRELEERK